LVRDVGPVPPLTACPLRARWDGFGFGLAERRFRVLPDLIGYDSLALRRRMRVDHRGAGAVMAQKYGWRITKVDTENRVPSTDGTRDFIRYLRL
jgi:hypothetical protein